MRHSLLSHLKKVCYLKKRPVDEVSCMEGYVMMQWIYWHVESGFESFSGSFQYHLLQGTQLARRGMGDALDAIVNPDMPAFEENLSENFFLKNFPWKKTFYEKQTKGL